jgi:hypothetical protein
MVAGRSIALLLQIEGQERRPNMADVTGPISSLPGSKHTVPAGQKCDCCDKPAIIRIQGETDSMGSEMNDYCLEHGTMRASYHSDLSGQCDWCHTEAILRPTRDMDEGMAGPVYYVCDSCQKKYRDDLLEEYNAMQKDKSNLGPDWDDQV